MLMNLMLLTEETTTYTAATAEEIANYGVTEWLFTGVGILVLSLLFVIPLFLAVIPANIAKKKGRLFAGYYVFGYFALIPAIIVTLCQKDVSEPERTMNDKINKWGGNNKGSK